MIQSNLNCKTIFKEAFNNRYTWPRNFNGYGGKCLFTNNEKSICGEFILGKSFQPQIKNIIDDDIVKSISSQLFEVCIHRVKRQFNNIHMKNNFKFLKESENGIEMQVAGKNEGDKYTVKDKKINMVYRHMHGVIIEIFVEEFLDTGHGYLSKKYTSQHLDPENLSPKSPCLEYLDNFINLTNSDLWVLESRVIKNIRQDQNEILYKYSFQDLFQI